LLARKAALQAKQEEKAKAKDDAILAKTAADELLEQKKIQKRKAERIAARTQGLAELSALCDSYTAGGLEDKQDFQENVLEKMSALLPGCHFEIALVEKRAQDHWDGTVQLLLASSTMPQRSDRHPSTHPAPRCGESDPRSIVKLAGSPTPTHPTHADLTLRGLAGKSCGGIACRKEGYLSSLWSLKRPSGWLTV